jgi:hypothetical protein
MRIEDIKAIRTNWKPVTFYLADGRKLRVKHQDFVLFSPSGAAIFVFEEPPSKNYQILDHNQIVSIERSE